MKYLKVRAAYTHMCIYSILSIYVFISIYMCICMLVHSICMAVKNYVLYYRCMQMYEILSFSLPFMNEHEGGLISSVGGVPVCA